jgi:hypothetical protein
LNNGVVANNFSSNNSSRGYSNIFGGVSSLD